MATAFITHPDTLLHVMDGNHPESPSRIIAIKNAMHAKQLFPQLAQYVAPEATDTQLQRVHSKRYIEHIRNIAPAAGLVWLDPDTAMGPVSLSACLHASGAAVLAVDLVMTNKVQTAFCCTRPPGHHAGRERAAGFCIFNNVSVGVAHALHQYGLQRVAILDFDVHHGDGTEDIFRNNPAVMLCSTFQHPFYPHRGADTRTERMLNIPLPAGTDGLAYRRKLEEDVRPALERFQPQLLFISAGFDAHANDPLAQLALQREDYAWITKFAREMAGRHAQGRIVSVLEGGYHLTSLAESAVAHIEGLM